MPLTVPQKRFAVGALYLASGLTALVYETVWIRLFTLSFGSTAPAFSAVIAVYLGGLAAGAALAGRITARAGARSSLSLYGAIEAFTGLYALTTPWTINAAQAMLGRLYGPGTGALALVSFGRIGLCAAILLLPTALMGATLPLLGEWLASNAESVSRASRFYSLNLVGATFGALLSGFVLLPSLGYAGTLRAACGVNLAVGAVAILLARKDTAPSPSVAPPAAAGRQGPQAGDLTARALGVVAFLCGATALIYEVVWARVFGLLFGPTASTVTLTLAAFLAGLGIGGALASRVRRHLAVWLSAGQFATAAVMLWASVWAAAAPEWVAEVVRGHAGNPGQLELMKAFALSVTVLPLAALAGLSFPLAMRLGGAAPAAVGRWIGTLYSVNTAGSILGSLAATWILVPHLGAERTLALAATLNLLIGAQLIWSLQPRRQSWLLAAAAVLATVLWIPRWDLAAMSAGAYKYAPYFDNAPQQLRQGDVVFLREGVAATVAVRRQLGALELSIDGKIDASDAGADLFTEKLLAHLPLSLAANAHRVCLIGLASGVTAGAALTYPIQALDIVEISPEVAHASNLFRHVNRSPLSDARSHLFLEDGRNHLALGSASYDVIISEPSNPWISGMNALFTRDFFRLARRRLVPGGLLAQWFHVYNMPPDDLRSLLRSFQEVFPSAILWQLNDGDVLLTGFAESTGPRLRDVSQTSLPSAAIADLQSVGAEPALLWTLYVMRGDDLKLFAGDAPLNTDDDPRLEFHGQRDLHAQTNLENTADLAAFSKLQSAPEVVASALAQMTPARLANRGAMFERAEAPRLAFRSYQLAIERDPALTTAILGLDRCARTPDERTAVARAAGLPAGADSLEIRSHLAIQREKAGDFPAAEAIFKDVVRDFAKEPSAHYNYAVFCLNRGKYQTAIAQFSESIALGGSDTAPYEGMTAAYLGLRDFPNAATWNRRVLEIDPTNSLALQTEQRIRVMFKK